MVERHGLEKVLCRKGVPTAADQADWSNVDNVVIVKSVLLGFSYEMTKDDAEDFIGEVEAAVTSGLEGHVYKNTNQSVKKS